MFRTARWTLATASLGAALATAADLDPKQEKVKHLDEVLAELRDRSSVERSDEEAATRMRNLTLLQQYRDRGRFPLNRDYPGRAVPYFIDASGTRCAVAYLMDHSGDGDLVEALASLDNHAYLASLQDDPRIDAWIARSGLTVEEVCYIQGPSFADVPPVMPDDPAITLSEDAVAESVGQAGPAGLPTATGGSAGAVGRQSARKNRPSASTSTWESWWTLNATAFADLRSANRSPLTGPDAYAGADRDAVVRDVLGRLRALSDEEDELGISVTMGLARTAQEADVREVLPAVLDYLARPDKQYPGFGVLALGVLGDPACRLPLTAILRDSSEGRGYLAERNPLPESVRAFAAIALGLCGGEGEAQALLEVASEDGASDQDLRAAAVAAIGLLGRDEEIGRAVIPGLHDLLRDLDVPTLIRAQVPTALARIGDPGSLPLVLSIVRGFKDRAEVRRSCAQALGMFDLPVARDRVDRLIASAKRDPDALVRAFAALSLAELADDEFDRSDAAEASALIAQFFSDALRGRVRTRADEPWHALAAGIYARGARSQATPVVDSLIRAATSPGSADRRAAAVLAVGLSGAERGIATLREVLADSSDTRVRGYAAEALGLLGDRASMPRMLELVRTASDVGLRYRTARGLGYLADRSTVRFLVKAFVDTPSDGIRGVLTRVLGEVGSPDAIEALAEVAADERQTDRARGRALAAMAMIAGDVGPSWVSALQRGANDSALTPTLRTVLALF